MLTNSNMEIGLLRKEFFEKIKLENFEYRKLRFAPFQSAKNVTRSWKWYNNFVPKSCLYG